MLDIFNLTPISFVSACQNFETNSLSQSQMMSSGIPFLHYQLLKKIKAMSSVVAVVFVETMQTSAPRWFMIESMQSKYQYFPHHEAVTRSVKIS